MSRLSPVSKNPRKVARRLRDQWGSPAYRAMFARLPCVVDPGWAGPSHPSHLKTRGSGGRYHSILPMSPLVHRRWEENEPDLIRQAEEENWFGWAAWIADEAERAGMIADPLPAEGRHPSVEPPRRLTLARLVRFYVEEPDLRTLNPTIYEET